MKGFTLIELLITVAIAAAFSYGGLLALVDYRGRQDLSLTSRSIVAILRDAQSRSESQEDGKLWGVRFDSVERSYGIFYGTTCVPEGFVSKVNIKANLEFSDPLTGVKDVCFKKISGASTFAGPVGESLRLVSNPATSRSG